MRTDSVKDGQPRWKLETATMAVFGYPLVFPMFSWYNKWVKSLN